MIKTLYRRLAIALVKPYVRRELPGWGILYRHAIGSWERDALWEEARERWIRGKLHGYEMSLRIGGWSNRSTFFLERFYDLPTQLLLQRLLQPGDLFVDVGANEGMMSLLASRHVGPDGRVMSFEPNPVPRAVFERNMARNGIENIEIHAMGLGDEAGELKLFVPSVNSGESSFTAPDDESAGTYVTCPVAVGDDMLGSTKPRLIKIDVEGFEYHVLEGLSATLSRSRPAVCLELIASHLLRDDVRPEDIFGFLGEHGYAGKRLGLSKRKDLLLIEAADDWIDGDYVFLHRDSPVI